MSTRDRIHLRQITNKLVIAGSGIAAGACLVLLTSPPISFTPFESAGMPSGLKAYTGNGLRADRVPSPVDGLNAWIVHTPASPESSAQLAVSATGSDGFVIGELFSATGEPVNDRLIGGDARSRARFVDLGIITKWVPITQSGLPNSNSVYLFASPLDPQMQMLWQVIREQSEQLPAIRLVPTAYTTPDAFEAVLDVFLAPHEIGGTAYSSRERLTAYLDGRRQVPQDLRDDPRPNPVAVNALSTNGNIHHRLRLDTQPTVISATADGGLRVQPLGAYLKAQTGVAIEPADASANNDYQG